MTIATPPRALTREEYDAMRQFRSPHFNQLTPAEAERLALLAEEAAEVIQVVGKILRHGYESTHPDGGPTNRGLLEKELGDFQCAMCRMFQRGDLSSQNVQIAESEKEERVKPFLHHQ